MDADRFQAEGSDDVRTPALGRFVRFEDSNTGVPTVGKIVERTDEALRVEVFRSPVSPEFETVMVAAMNATPFVVPPQSLVYVRIGQRWAMGRVIKRDGWSNLILKFPNQRESVSVPTREVVIRSPRFADDPTTLLAGQVTSSPTFTEARHRLIEFVASQRGSYRGLTALATACVELYHHQIAAVNRVLADPVHRYLLADEVGLGKTVEAGLLIAQHLIDEGSSATVVLIVPDVLVEQWSSELASIFGLKNDPRVRIVAFSGLINARDAGLLLPLPTLVVVDEAHLSASWAFPAERGTDGEPAALDESRYPILEELARCPKLLLLSGTPVLHHEDGFLAMLHLLEPDAYSLADREGFRIRVAARTVVADALAQLTSDYQTDFLSAALAALSTTLDSDTELTDRVQSVRNALDIDPANAVHSIDELRSYLLERYRLHRRIVRTHRESKGVANLLPKRCGLRFFSAETDRARERAYGALEGWRTETAEGFENGSAERAQVASVFVQFLSNAIAHPSQLGRAFEERAVALQNGAAKPFFEDETTWLRDVASEFVRPSNDDDVRAAAIAEFLQAGLPSQRRAVVFVDSPTTADLVVRRISRSEKLRPRVLRFSAQDPDCVSRYENCANAILVCDRGAEQGLNLQRKPATIVFYDLPFDIGRVEQRIGRFDRLEGMKELSFHMAEPIGHYERGWQRLLREQIRIFDRSVARLQYVLSDALTAFRSELLELGPVEAFEAIAGRFADPKTGLDAALKRLRRQETLDATAWEIDEQESFVDLFTAARETSVDDARDAIEGWLKELQFEIEERDDKGVVYTHVQTYNGRGGTVTPLSPFSRWAGQWITRRFPARTRTDTRFDFGPFTFDPEDRSDASALLGIGHPFFDTIFDCMKGDDRSRSWAMWRYQPRVAEPEFYVRFDLVIEASLEHVMPIARKWRTAASLRRRADGVLPVEQQTVWMDFEGNHVTDASLLKTLSRPYVRDPAVDTNLNDERWAAANHHVPVGDWGARILRLRREVEESVRADAALQRRCREAEERVVNMTRRAVRILRSRAAHAPAGERETLESAIGFESELGEGLQRGVRNPNLHIDNAGVIVLAPRPFDL